MIMEALKERNLLTQLGQTTAEDDVMEPGQHRSSDSKTSTEKNTTAKMETDADNDSMAGNRIHCLTGEGSRRCSRRCTGRRDT